MEGGSYTDAVHVGCQRERQRGEGQLSCAGPSSVLSAELTCAALLPFFCFCFERFAMVVELFEYMKMIVN